MTNASFIIKAKLFIHQSPGLIGECALIVGIVLPWILPFPERWAGLLAIVVGIFILVYKYQQLKFHLYVLENSQLAEGEVVDIRSTDLDHNDRPVMEYRVRFVAVNRPFHHEFQSAKTKGLVIGSKVRVCYRVDDPTCAFVPAFFNISL